MTSALNHNERLLLQRVARGPVSFTHAPLVSGKGTKLVKSTLSPSQQAPLASLASRGLLARAVTGSAPHFPLETHVTYTITSLGQEALGMQPARKPRVNRNLPLTDEELEREGCR
jgi:hypothetical protein